MSQIYKSLTSGPVPPAVPTSFVTDVNSPAIPALNILDVFGGETTADNTNGIRTDGSSGGNILTVQLTNRITGTATTTDGVTVKTIYSFPLGATPGTYLFDVKIVGYNVTDGTSAGYESSRCVKTNGALASEIGTDLGIVAEEGTMVNVLVANGVSGNNNILQVTGLAGKTIHWYALTTYMFIS